jgi:hypothetical protein
MLKLINHGNIPYVITKENQMDYYEYVFKKEGENRKINRCKSLVSLQAFCSFDLLRGAQC